METLLIVLLVIFNLPLLPLGLFWAFYVHPKMLKEEQQFNEFKRGYLRQWR